MNRPPPENPSVGDLARWIERDLVASVPPVTVTGELVEARTSKAGGWGEIVSRNAEGRIVARLPYVARWEQAQKLRRLKGRTLTVTGQLSSHPLYGLLRLSIDSYRVAKVPRLVIDQDLVAAAKASQDAIAWPNPIRRVGLVGPATASAGIGDLYTALGRLPVVVEEHRAKMNGPVAAPMIARAILTAAVRCDLVIATRGGGASVDLAAWDQPEIVEAIGASQVPVVVAVGHARDTHAADLAAAVSLATPTAAGTWLAEQLIGQDSDST